MRNTFRTFLPANVSNDWESLEPLSRPMFGQKSSRIFRHNRFPDFKHGSLSVDSKERGKREKHIKSSDCNLAHFANSKSAPRCKNIRCYLLPGRAEKKFEFCACNCFLVRKPTFFLLYEKGRSFSFGFFKAISFVFIGLGNVLWTEMLHAWIYRDLVSFADAGKCQKHASEHLPKLWSRSLSRFRKERHFCLLSNKPEENLWQKLTGRLAKNCQEIDDCTGRFWREIQSSIC